MVWQWSPRSGASHTAPGARRWTACAWVGAAVVAVAAPGEVAAKEAVAVLLAAAAPVGASEGWGKGETRVPVAPPRQHRHQHNDKDMQ